MILPQITMQRIYDPDTGGSTRILVDRLWPRGISKERAELDLWLRDVAPSNELRKWYNHDPEKTAEFQRRYREELQAPEQAAAFAELQRLALAEPLVLLTASKTLDISHAAFLQELLTGAA